MGEVGRMDPEIIAGGLSRKGISWQGVKEKRKCKSAQVVTDERSHGMFIGCQ